MASLLGILHRNCRSLLSEVADTGLDRAIRQLNPRDETTLPSCSERSNTIFFFPAYIASFVVVVAFVLLVKSARILREY